MIRTDHPHFLVAANSHPGETGKNNEDAFSVTSYQLEAGRTPSLLVVVADGIGGHQAGEVAAHLAVDTVVQRVATSAGRDPLAVLRAGVVEAGRAIQRGGGSLPGSRRHGLDDRRRLGDWWPAVHRLGGRLAHLPAACGGAAPADDRSHLGPGGARSRRHHAGRGPRPSARARPAPPSGWAAGPAA